DPRQERAGEPYRQSRAAKRYSSDLPRSSPAACHQTNLEDRPCKPYSADCSRSLGTFCSASGSSFLVGLLMVAVIALFQRGTALRRWRHTICTVRELSFWAIPSMRSAAPLNRHFKTNSILKDETALFAAIRFAGF